MPRRSVGSGRRVGLHYRRPVSMRAIRRLGRYSRRGSGYYAPKRTGPTGASPLPIILMVGFLLFFLSNIAITLVTILSPEAFFLDNTWMFFIPIIGLALLITIVVVRLIVLSPKAATGISHDTTPLNLQKLTTLGYAFQLLQEQGLPPLTLLTRNHTTIILVALQKTMFSATQYQSLTTVALRYPKTYIWLIDTEGIAQDSDKNYAHFFNAQIYTLEEAFNEATKLA